MYYNFFEVVLLYQEFYLQFNQVRKVSFDIFSFEVKEQLFIFYSPTMFSTPI